IIIEPSPSWPWELSPQHHREPSVLIAQLWPYPSATVATLVCSAATWTGVGFFTVIEPIPSSPALPCPQHHREPSVLIVQAWFIPSAMAVTSVPRAVTCTGVALLVIEPFPNWPTSLLPQHHREPLVLRAQVYPFPSMIAVALVPKAVTCTGVALLVIEPF